MCCRTFTMFNDCVAKLLEERSNFSVTEVGAPVTEIIHIIGGTLDLRQCQLDGFPDLG
jgi:hypothetical protein